VIDEGTLRERFPEIPWDQPQEVSVLAEQAVEVPEGTTFLTSHGYESFWVCRYCVSLYGVKASDLLDHRVPFAFQTREHCLDHIEREHHD